MELSQKLLCDMPEIGDLVTFNNGTMAFAINFKALKVLVLGFDLSHHRKDSMPQNDTSEPLREALRQTWKAHRIKALTLPMSPKWGGVPTTCYRLLE